MKSGCSSFSWETEDKNHLLGRTYDQFGNLDGNKIAFIPKGYSIKLEINEKSKSIISTKYGCIGMSVMGLSVPIMVDGINEKGLMGALLNYPDYAVYETQKTENNTDIHPAFLVAYLLGICSTVSQVADELTKINLTNERIFNQKMEVHYIFSDKTGETIIIEPDENQISVHRETIGVLTNSPNYIWHKTNLRNYVAVTNLHKPSQIIVNTKISEFGEKLGGGFGLPGDYSSTSRFIRMAFLKQFAVTAKNEIDGITKMFHNFASVDIPEGILKSDPNEEFYEKTLCISAMCCESLTYYFSVSTNRRISAIKLQKELDNTQIKYFDLQEIQDISYIN